MMSDRDELELRETETAEPGYAERIKESAQQIDYIPSETVTAAHDQLTGVAAGRPADYTSANADQLRGLYDKLINREAYSYDPMKDGVYNQYRNQYQQMMAQGADEAQRATAGMSGGYGSTWSAAAANQQYGEGMKAMNDILPALEQNAYAGYQAEGNLIQTQLQTAIDKDESDYRKWKSSYDQWAADRDFALQQSESAWQKDYQQWRDNTDLAMTLIGWGREDAETVRSTAYAMAVEMIKTGVLPIDSLLEQAGIAKDRALKLAKKYGYKPGSGSSSGGSKKGSGTSATGGKDAAKTGSSTKYDPLKMP